MAIPYDGRLALVRDADCRHIRGLPTDRLERAADDLMCPLNDLYWIVLDPTGLWKNLAMLKLVGSRDVSGLVEQNETRACGTLIKRANELSCHHSPAGCT
ncbi:MAG: hypothetical protein BroJett007_08330 [Chloroflexota bacterium]|nr:MAG: hypothetical protein BroJett007_08330 [Chloroflexota bacterium]